MNTDVRLLMAKGSLHALRSINDEWDPLLHGVLNILEDEWDVLRSNSPWQRPDYMAARNAFNSALTGAIANLSLPAFALSAEYVAMAIVQLVDPVNWMSACRFALTIDGLKIATADGDYADAREVVPADKVHSLCMMFAHNSELKTFGERLRQLDYDGVPANAD